MTGDGPIRYGELAGRGDWVLAFDTSGSTGSIALGRSGETVREVSLGKPRQHAASLLVRLEGLLDLEDITIRDIGGIVVGAGPGSFTGVRVAAATAKGLCHGLRVPVWPVSSLLAAACDPTAAWVSTFRAVLFDARSDRVYGAAYRVDVGSVAVAVPPFASDLDSATSLILDSTAGSGVDFGGAGSWRHRARLEAEGIVVRREPTGRPSGSGLLEALRLDPDTAADENPARWEPEYLRASSAERSRAGGHRFDSG